MKIIICGVMIIIGDSMETMEREHNLIDIGFQNFTKEEKRNTFLVLDMVMKEYHKKGYMITSFNPKDIYYENQMFSFSKYEKISPINSNDVNDAILSNIISLANLTFCSYLPMYDINQGLLNSEVVSKYYEKFESNFIPIDRAYYRSILVDSVRNKKMPEVPYLYDHITKVMENTDLSNQNNSNVASYIKATEAGRLMAEKNEEAAFSTIFYLTCMVSAMLIAFIGLAIYFLK